VLEGSVRRSGDRLRITAQLIDARTDSHLWSETYDRTLDDVFDVQDEIAAQVVDALRLELLEPAPRARRVDRQAYVLLMHARQLLDSSGDDHQRIHDLLQQSIAIDPQQPDAWTTLSWLWFRCTLQDVRAHDPYCEQYTLEEANRLVIEAYERALLIDPEHSVAIAYRAAQMAFKQHQWQGAATEFERALRLGPEQTDVARSAMIFARFIRRPDAAIELGEYVLSRDPLCSLCAYQLALAYRDAGQRETAETTMRNFAAATGRGGWHTISMLRLLDGDAEGALATLENLDDVADPWRLHGQALALHALGRRQEALEITDELERIAAADRPALVAEVYAWMGDLERAYPWLHKAAESRSSRNEFNAFDWTSPFLRPLLDTSRGQAVLRRFGVADGQLAAIRFEVPVPNETAAVSGGDATTQSAALTQSREHVQKR
jgi:tetratricopeptide (TPR) repeat protein